MEYEVTCLFRLVRLQPLEEFLNLRSRSLAGYYLVPVMVSYLRL